MVNPAQIRASSGATIIQQRPPNVQIQSHPPALHPVSQNTFAPGGAQVSASTSSVAKYNLKIYRSHSCARLFYFRFVHIYFCFPFFVRRIPSTSTHTLTRSLIVNCYFLCISFVALDFECKLPSASMENGHTRRTHCTHTHTHTSSFHSKQHKLGRKKRRTCLTLNQTPVPKLVQ